MVLLVPFDGSALAETALSRASEFGRLMDEEVVALVVLPQDEGFARERGWIDEGEPLDVESIRTRLERRAADIAPEATFRYEPTEEVSLTATTTTDVVRTIREVAADLDASILFVGSENAGQVSTSVTSVGNPVSKDPRYDVHIVRHADEEFATREG